MRRVAKSLCLFVLAVSGCSGHSETCDPELPAGFSCSESLTVTAGECEANAVDATLTTSVVLEGDHLLVQNAMFRCEQRVCAYSDVTETPARIVLQPCEMDPDELVRCSCYSTYTVELPDAPTAIDVYVRGDHQSGRDEPELVGSIDFSGAPPVLCDGSSALRFAATDAGGNLSGVPSVVAEVGWSFLLVDGQCRYWTMSAPEKEMRSGSLSEQDAADFSADLWLGRWSELPAPDPSGCPDASTTSLRFGNEVAPPISCTSTEVSEGYRSWLTPLYESGTALGGEVRYTLQDSYGSGDDQALGWPLESDPAEIAVVSDEMAEPELADGENAAALRTLRDTYAESVQPGLGPWLRVPVAFESGSTTAYYELALRDVTPFEVDGKLEPDRFFE